MTDGNTAPLSPVTDDPTQVKGVFDRVIDMLVERSNLSLQVQNLQRNLDANMERLQRVTQDRDEVRYKLTQAEENAKTLEARLATASQDIEEFRRQVQGLRDEVKKLETDMLQAWDARDKAQEDARVTSANLQIANSDISWLRGQVDTARAQGSELQQKLATREREFNDTVASLRADAANAADRAKHDLDEVTQERDTLKATLSQIDEALAKVGLRRPETNPVPTPPEHSPGVSSGYGEVQSGSGGDVPHPSGDVRPEPSTDGEHPSPSAGPEGNHGPEVSTGPVPYHIEGGPEPGPQPYRSYPF